MVPTQVQIQNSIASQIAATDNRFVMSTYADSPGLNPSEYNSNSYGLHNTFYDFLGRLAGSIYSAWNSFQSGILVALTMCTGGSAPPGGLLLNTNATISPGMLVVTAPFQLPRFTWPDPPYSRSSQIDAMIQAISDVLRINTLTWALTWTKVGLYTGGNLMWSPGPTVPGPWVGANYTSGSFNDSNLLSTGINVPFQPESMANMAQMFSRGIQWWNSENFYYNYLLGIFKGFDLMWRQWLSNTVLFGGSGTGVGAGTLWIGFITGARLQ